MGRRRKTVKVREVLEMANVRLQSRDVGSPEGRRAIACLIESLLHNTGNYAGFGYVDGWPCEDLTRVVYYTHRNLQ